jgi:hypothetical protein
VIEARQAGASSPMILVFHTPTMSPTLSIEENPDVAE